jgi:hypothetical protein
MGDWELGIGHWALAVRSLEETSRRKTHRRIGHWALGRQLFSTLMKMPAIGVKAKTGVPNRNQSVPMADRRIPY